MGERCLQVGRLGCCVAEYLNGQLDANSWEVGVGKGLGEESLILEGRMLAQEGRHEIRLKVGYMWWNGEKSYSSE